MQPDIATLTALLTTLESELDACLHHTQSLGHDQTIADPVLLGDFIVDTYNRYLSMAKSLFDHPLLTPMSDIEPLGDQFLVERAQEGAVGHHPRVVKMSEVAMAVRQVKTILEGGVGTKADRAQSEAAGAIALLENLGEQIEDTSQLDLGGEDAGALAALVSEYNRCLELVSSRGDDAVVRRMFRQLSVGDDDVSATAKLAETRLAQAGLLRYLTTAAQRAPAYGAYRAALPSSDGYRNPFGEKFDPPNPDGPENAAFAQIATVNGSDTDINAEAWSKADVGDVSDSLNGLWSWGTYVDGEVYRGSARIGQIENRVYIRHPFEADGTVYLIEARREDDRLVGQYADRANPTNVGPWVGLIVDNCRIDGETEAGRWDFRR
ncbi:hypothetical protein CMK11_18960 [Candidatus Poribacteria bacterium]|nr:hypothetical protein [Candidatus Poribacteria bacterium]